MQADVLSSLFKTPITTPLANRILAGDQEAILEYRSKLWWFVASDKALVDRMLSERNLDRLREARDLGIPPAHIMALCHMDAPRTWSTRKTPTASEAKRMAMKLRRTRDFLKDLLPQLMFPMFERPSDDAPASQLPIQPNTATPSWVAGCFPIIDAASMEKLWEIVGRQDTQDQPPPLNKLGEILQLDKPGILDELADRLEAIIPTLQQIKPARRKQPNNSNQNSWQSINYCELMFANSWDKLARESTHDPHDRLGAWFHEVTFGLHIEQDAFRKQREEAYRRWGH